VSRVKNQPVLKFVKKFQPNPVRTRDERSWLPDFNSFWQLCSFVYVILRWMKWKYKKLVTVEIKVFYFSRLKQCCGCGRNNCGETIACVGKNC